MSAGQLEQRFARARQLQDELQRRERAIGRKVQDLAKGIADLMEAGAYLHRRGVGLHAFDVSGAVSLAAAYLEPEGGDYRYRYAVLCGGEAAKRALRTAVLDPTDCGDPGPGRRIVLATYADYSDFIERLPAYLADITRTIEGRVQQTAGAEAQIRRARRRVSSMTKRRPPENGSQLRSPFVNGSPARSRRPRCPVRVA